MQLSQQQQQQQQQPPPPRINISDLKAQLVKKLGPERSKRYFYYLNRLLSRKLTKAEFDKLCFLTLGRENLPLHNQLIRSILRNACQAKVPPPPVREKEAPTTKLIVKKSSPTLENGYQQNGPAAPSLSQGPPLFWSNGDVLPTSPRKSRSGAREKRPRDWAADRPSLLGPNGKTEFASHHSVVADDEVVKIITENGDSISHDLQRSIAELPDNDQDASPRRSTKRPRTKKLPEDEPVSVHIKGSSDAVLVEDRDGVEEAGNSYSTTRSPLSAPLGIPFYSASIGGVRRTLPTASSSSYTSTCMSGGLPDTDTLRKRMEQIAGAHGLEGMSTDCANLLNNGLDTYLKRLIRSCVELVGARSGHEPTRVPVYKQRPHGKLISGTWVGQQLQMQSGVMPMEGMQEIRSHSPISLLDFKVAMELNPQQLGEDWSLLLEKICLQSYEE